MVLEAADVHWWIYPQFISALRNTYVTIAVAFVKR
jgi:hypothetical protein